MTTPAERYTALARARQFISNITVDLDLPAELREIAYRLLKHYPSSFYLDELAEVAPQILEIPYENRTDF